MSRPLFLCASVAALLVAGCHAKQPSQAPVTADAQPEPAAAAPKAVADPSPTTAAPRELVRYGWVRIPRPVDLLDDARRHFIFRDQLGGVNEQMAKTFVVSALRGPMASIAHWDLSQPIGCVVASPKQYELPVACAVGYQGGVAQLVKDLGAESLRSGGSDFAELEVNDQRLFAKTLGQHVALSLDPRLIADTEQWLTSTIINAPATEGPDVQLAVLPATIYADAKEEIEDALREVNDERLRSAKPGTSGVDPTRQLRQLKDASTYELWFDIDAQRSELGYRGVAVPGTQTAKDYQRTHDAPAVTSKTLSLPTPDASITVAFSAQAMDWQDPTYREVFEAASQQNPALSKTQLELVLGMFEFFADALQGQSIATLTTPTKGPWTMLYAYDLRPDADAMSRFRAFFAKAKGTAVTSGPGVPLRYAWKKAAYTVRGRPADVVTVAMPPSDASARSPNTREILFGRRDRIESAFAQVDNRVLGIATSGSSKAQLRAFAKRINASTARPVPAMKAITEAVSAWFVVSVDVDQLVGWVQRFWPDRRKLELRSEPEDVVMFGTSPSPGTREVRLQVSKPLLQQFGDL